MEDLHYFHARIYSQDMKTWLREVLKNNQATHPITYPNLDIVPISRNLYIL